jgi:hypothetical protein
MKIMKEVTLKMGLYIFETLAYIQRPFFTRFALIIVRSSIQCCHVFWLPNYGHPKLINSMQSRPS